MTLLRRAAEALDEADRRGLELDETRGFVAQHPVAGWRLDAPPKVPVRKKGTRRVLEVAG